MKFKILFIFLSTFIFSLFLVDLLAERRLLTFEWTQINGPYRHAPSSLGGAYEAHANARHSSTKKRFGADTLILSTWALPNRDELVAMDIARLRVWEPHIASQVCWARRQDYDYVLDTRDFADLRGFGERRAVPQWNYVHTARDWLRRRDADNNSNKETYRVVFPMDLDYIILNTATNLDDYILHLLSQDDANDTKAFDDGKVPDTNKWDDNIDVVAINEFMCRTWSLPSSMNILRNRHATRQFVDEWMSYDHCAWFYHEQTAQWPALWHTMELPLHADEVRQCDHWLRRCYENVTELFTKPPRAISQYDWDTFLCYRDQLKKRLNNINYQRYGRLAIATTPLLECHGDRSLQMYELNGTALSAAVQAPTLHIQGAWGDGIIDEQSLSHYRDRNVLAIHTKHDDNGGFALAHDQRSWDACWRSMFYLMEPGLRTLLDAHRRTIRHGVRAAPLDERVREAVRAAGSVPHDESAPPISDEALRLAQNALLQASAQLAVDLFDYADAHLGESRWGQCVGANVLGADASSATACAVRVTSPPVSPLDGVAQRTLIAAVLPVLGIALEGQREAHACDYLIERAAGGTWPDFLLWTRTPDRIDSLLHERRLFATILESPDTILRYTWQRHKAGLEARASDEDALSNDEFARLHGNRQCQRILERDIGLNTRSSQAIARLRHVAWLGVGGTRGAWQLTAEYFARLALLYDAAHANVEARVDALQRRILHVALNGTQWRDSQTMHGGAVWPAERVARLPSVSATLCDHRLYRYALTFEMPRRVRAMRYLYKVAATVASVANATHAT